MMFQKLAYSTTASSVAKFYNNKNVFITGGTGFVGKVIVEKLLRSCPGVSRIYLLMRPKKEQTVEERLQKAICSPLFDIIRKQNPNDLSKLLPIVGDISQPKLGINENDRELLSRSVNIVFHSAATIKFNEPVTTATRLNLIGTQRVTELCREMPDLKAYIYVSTAFSNPQQLRIEEKVYYPSIDPDELVSKVETLDKDVLDAMTPRLVGDYQNSYVLTKALTERWLADNKGDLPIAIIRPSQILSAAEEPIKGWLDSWAGPTGLVTAASQGTVKTVLCDKQKKPDFIPVDMVANLIIVLAWKLASSKTSEIAVYNCVTGQRNPINFDRYFLLSSKYLRNHKVSNFNWYYSDGFTTLSHMVYTVKSLLLHWIPAYLTDFYLRVTGEKPKMVKTQNYLLKNNDVLKGFLCNEWEIIDDNFKTLSDILSKEDKKLFNIDVESIDWESYFNNYALGIKRYLLKQQ